MQEEKQDTTDAARQRESGVPGGGAGRRDEVGGSGVYPASAGSAPGDAVVRTPAEWGQGDRGAAGYEDSGCSELFFTEEEMRAAREGRPLHGPPEPGPGRSPARPSRSDRDRQG